jgi:8-oxo-dGTP diphosphatase
MREVFFCHMADNDALQFAAVVPRYQGKWVYCKQEDRNTYELPGGSRRDAENIEATARRVLSEKTGAACFRMMPVSIYGVRKEDGSEAFGMLYFAEVQEFFPLPVSETKRTELFGGIPGELTFPDIEPVLQHRVEDFLKETFPAGPGPEVP